uniref:Chromo domain-containing protein n=1 Tax=Panagrolaimus sp. PS1159 TaxID=55785 RepID=A0AC35FLG9_9BILA
MSLMESQIMNQQFEEKFESRRRKLKAKLGLDEDVVDTDDCESECDAEIEIDNKEYFSVEAVWDTRKVNGQKQYEVKWKGFPETSWEPLDSFVSKSSRLAIVQFYERMWKKKQAAKLENKKVIKMEVEPPSISSKKDHQSRANSNKKFSSSLGGKRPPSSNPQRKDREEEKGWVKKMKIYQEKKLQTQERIQHEKELAENRMEEEELSEYLKRMKKLKEDLGSSDDEIDNDD